MKTLILSPALQASIESLSRLDPEILFQQILYHDSKCQSVDARGSAFRKSSMRFRVHAVEVFKRTEALILSLDRESRWGELEWPVRKLSKSIQTARYWRTIGLNWYQSS